MGVDAYRLLPEYVRGTGPDVDEATFNPDEFNPDEFITADQLANPLRRWLRAATAQADRAWTAIDALDPVTATGGRSAAADPSQAPAILVPWLALVAGLLPDYASLPVDKLRTILAAPAASRARGSAAAIAGSVATTLTGARTVTVETHAAGDPWRIVVHTAAAETPDPARTLAAAMREKPAGVLLTVATDA